MTNIEQLKGLLTEVFHEEPPAYDSLVRAEDEAWLKRNVEIAEDTCRVYAARHCLSVKNMVDFYVESMELAIVRKDYETARKFAGRVVCSMVDVFSLLDEKEKAEKEVAE